MIAGVTLASLAVLAPPHSLVGPAEYVIVKGQKLFDSSISLYKGRKYVEEDNKLRFCVRFRESRHAYGANTGTGKYRGAYQASTEMARGMAWMIQKELKATGTPAIVAERIGKKLRANKINNWSIYYQDMAFWLVWNHGEGKSHWDATNYGGGCKQ